MIKPCVIMPAFNEAEHIGGVIETLFVDHSDLIGELVVVDDGSTDGTGDIAAGLGARVLRHRRNLGKGRALRTGFNYALDRGYQAVITMDSDGQHDPADIPRFIDRYRMGDVDIVLGSREHERGRMPLHRRLNNRLVSFVGSWLAGQQIYDFQCGYRMLSCDVIKKIKLSTARYETESELLIGAGRLGYRIASIPIETIYNGARSNVDTLVEMKLFTLLLFRSLRKG